MTVCNMSIEAGARAGMIAPDETTFDYLQGPRQRAEGRRLDAAVADWRTLRHRRRREVRQVARLRRRDIAPQVTWGTNPARSPPVDGSVPSPADFADANDTQDRAAGASSTWASSAGTPIARHRIDRVFIGSCTNARIEDLRAAAAVVEGLPRRRSRRAMVVPGSGR